MRCIDELEPALPLLACTTPNSAASIYYVSEELRAALPALPRNSLLVRPAVWSAASQNCPDAIEYAPAIFQIPSVRNMYDFLEEAKSVSRPPAGMIQQGASSFEYAGALWHEWAFIVEMPYWDDPRVSDLSESTLTRRDAVIESAHRIMATCDWLSEQMDQAAPHLRLDTPLRRAAIDSNTIVKRWSAGRIHWVESAPEADDPATVAELFSNQVSWASYAQRAVPCGYVPLNRICRR